MSKGSDGLIQQVLCVAFSFSLDSSCHLIACGFDALLPAAFLFSRMLNRNTMVLMQ